MPSKHIYLKDEDEVIWEQAKKLGPVSSVIVDALKFYINSQKNEQIVIEIKVGDQSQKFIGTRLDKA